MKTARAVIIIAVLLVLMAVVSKCHGGATPLYNAFLQNNLNGNGQKITNAYYQGDLTQATNLLAAGISTNGSASGQVLMSSNGIVGWVNNQYFVGTGTTNLALQSHQTTLLASNTFTMSGSNYVGRFTNMVEWRLIAPQVGGGSISVPTTLAESMWGSYSGSGGWFKLTNSIAAPTNISLAVVGTNITGVGSVTVYGMDHPELYGLTVAFDYQTFLSRGSPIATQTDLANTVHVLAPPVQMAGGWQLDSGYNSGTELVTWINHNLPIFQLSSSGSSIPQASGGLDGTGTNLLITTPLTNLLAGWYLEECTNLIAPIQWFSTTNYSTNLSAGVVTFTVPIDFTAQATFLRLELPAAVSATFTVPVAATQLISADGVWYPSNTWSLATITNGMASGGYWLGNSNGAALVSVSLSNGVVRIKQLSP